MSKNSDSRVLLLKRQYKRLGKVLGEENEEEVVEVTTPPEGVPTGETSVRAGFTKGLGDYCSISFSASVSFPCVPEEEEDAYNHAYQLVWKRVGDELKEIKQRYDDGRKPL